MPKRNMRDLIKKETSSQTSKTTDSSRTKLTEQQTNNVTDSVTHEDTDSRSTEQEESGSNEETELQLNQRSPRQPVVSQQGTDDQQSDSSQDETTEQQRSKLIDSESNKQPKYLTLLRKEARLREDQFDDLTALARTLNRRRKGGERITENTLIRLAVDLLLKEADQLEGSTEEELREALNL